MQQTIRADEYYYENIYQKQYSLFWVVVNMACLLLAPCILSLLWSANYYLRLTVFCFFLMNIFYHLLIIFRYQKKPCDEGDENSFSSNHQTKHVEKVRKWTWIEITDRSKLRETENETFTLASYMSTSIGLGTSDELVSFGSADEESKISCAYKYEVGILITPARLVIKSCCCHVPDWKCRLCPFRAYPIPYFKSWFWYPIEYAAEECMECGESCLVSEEEYEQLLVTSYPLHLCDCDCRYCLYAKKRPLEPRVNLLPDDKHCFCICRKCRIIEELIQGLEPHEEQQPSDEDQDTSEVWGDFSEEEKSLQFWSPPQTCNKRRSPAAVLKNLVYHFSPPGESANSSIGDSRSLQLSNELCTTFGVNPVNFVSWTSNLRNWISNTILKRIVEEINRIDDGLISQGLSLVSVGHVGFDTLKATAYSEQIRKNVPTLLLLLPFLEISSNQEYIVQRIRELAVGNTMREFAGQSGGKFNDIPWDAHLPSDAELVMHLMVTYFDAKLPPLINEPLRRPFSTQYFAKAPKLPSQTELAIYQQGSTPPHYQLILNDELQQIPSGTNNVFFVLLLFINCIKMNHDGMLGRINLGPAGLNMLWIVEDLSRI